ncbi:hypothetical protein N3K66_005207 [Trichothecium roseum]|uniref:Uncharacterized protein n=1 Tax=Trichothecium roseum TaxID=47278 RepID=A0ACC0V3H1_9HYPO|nr:hypothetical protein N3K66_005207 [Trichothecium roseum]
MPTLPIYIVSWDKTLGFSVVLDNGNKYEGHLNLGVPVQIFRCGPNATVTFDSEGDLAGTHEYTCTFTSTTTKVTAANGVVIDNPVPEELVTDVRGGDDKFLETKGSMTWET